MPVTWWLWRRYFGSSSPIVREVSRKTYSQQLAQSSNRVVCRRPPEAALKFAIGMEVRSGTNEWNGVIVSWDLHCKASDEWIEKKGIRKLARGVDQPFYRVLGYYDEYRYEAEGNEENQKLNILIAYYNFCSLDNLKIIARPWLNYESSSQQMGIHFERCDGRRYIPNAEKRTHFPDDDAAVQLLLN